MSGPKGRICYYVRSGERCPGKHFMEKECRQHFPGRFTGQFKQIAHFMGAEYVNDQRFRPLKGAGKPLWEFKEHDHRLYCLREEIANGRVEITLFNGWVKDKRRSNEEKSQIIAGKNLLEEFRAESKRP